MHDCENQPSGRLSSGRTTASFSRPVSFPRVLRESWAALSAKKRFVIFASGLGGATLLIAFLRAAITGITYDEAFTYLYYVRPDFLRSFSPGAQLLNNHILYTLCAKFFEAASHARYSEILLRMPSLTAGAVYVYFAYNISKSFKYGALIFSLFVLNVYLNEFFSLARGYGMSAACVAGALYCCERWQKDTRNLAMFNLCMIWFCCAGLANSIAIYIWCSALSVMGAKIARAKLLGLYVKNPLNFLFIAVGVFVCAFNIYVSRQGRPIFSHHEVYHSVIMSIPRMMFPAEAAGMAFAVLMSLLFIFSLLRQHVRNSYLMMLIVYVGICMASEWIFHRGYPLDRTMLPVYPLFILAAAKAIDRLGRDRRLERAAAVCILILCLSFAAKVSIHGTRDWADDYPLRADVLNYVATHTLTENEEDFKNFVAGYEQARHPTAIFYFEKLKYMLSGK